MPRLFKSQIGSQVWNPRYHKYIARIERIQMKFIKFLCYRLRTPTKIGYENYIKLSKQFHFRSLY